MPRRRLNKETEIQRRVLNRHWTKESQSRKCIQIRSQQPSSSSMVCFLRISQISRMSNKIFQASIKLSKKRAWAKILISQMCWAYSIEARQVIKELREAASRSTSLNLRRTWSKRSNKKDKVKCNNAKLINNTTISGIRSTRAKDKTSTAKMLNLTSKRSKLRRWVKTAWSNLNRCKTKFRDRL